MNGESKVETAFEALKALSYPGAIVSVRILGGRVGRTPSEVHDDVRRNAKPGVAEWIADLDGYRLAV